MTDHDTRIRGLLDELAGDAHLDPAREATTLRRVRRRRFANVAASVVFVVVALTAGAVGIRHLQVGALPESPGPNPSGAVSPTPGRKPTMRPCGGSGFQTALWSQTGAAGTIRTVWKATNVGQLACRSYGYPGVDLHGSTGWLGITVTRGGYPDIDITPEHIVVRPGRAVFFVSYWSDATTNAGSCRSFDHVKITPPNAFPPMVLPASGCATPTSVRVGPVQPLPPAP